MRQFKLINADGEEVNLMDRASFFHRPSGLGYSYSYAIQGAGSEFIPTEKKLDQKDISGEMVFLGREPYKSYDEFVRFCTKTPLKLCYKPLDRWYYLDCEVRTLDKSEISCGLICPIDFIPFGSWYESVIAYRTALDKDFGKRYPYRYNYTYTETARGAAVIDNSGSMESYCRIHVLGPCVNPAWALEQDGKVKVRGRVMASIPEGHELIVDSSPKSMEIAEYTQDGEFIRNLYQASDFATGRFVAVPVGESKMSFSHEGAGMIEAYVEVRALSESV